MTARICWTGALALAALALGALVGCDGEAACGAGCDAGSGATAGTAGTGGAGSGGTSGAGAAGGTGGTSGAGATGGTGGTSGAGATGGTSGAGATGGTGGTSGAGATGGTGGTSEECTGPLSEPKPNCEPTALPTTGDLAQDCVDRINQFRAECQCLGPLMRWTEGEACAAQQAQYDFEHDETAHAGFRADICDGGRGQNECPGWGSEQQVINRCLQQMWNEGPGEPFSAHGHYINMTNPDHTRVACGFYTTPEGDIWAIQNFR